MLGKINTVLTAAQNAIVQSIKNTQSAIDKAQQRLASGKDVNSPLDGPSAFFTARMLSNRAADLSNLLDGIGQNIQSIRAANAGAEAISKLVDQAEALLDEARVELYADGRTSLKPALSASDIAAIVAANPGVVYSSDTHSFYRLGGPATATAAEAAANAATLIEPPGVTGVAGVTGHLANITSATENAFVNSITPGNAWIGGSDSAVEGEWRYTSGPEAGQQFWQGGVGGSAPPGAYANWGAGEPNNSGGNEDYVHMRTDGLWNDLAPGNNYNYVVEWDESLFLPTPDAKLVARAAEYTRQYLALLDQITMLAKDTQYRGLQLLKGETLRTQFNEDGTSFLLTEGIDATADGLGLSNFDFFTRDGLDLSKERIGVARNDVRNYASRLAMDLSIMSIRFDFTKSTINVHKEGASALTDADQNETGAQLLALQLRQQLQMSALRLASQNLIQRLF